MQAQLKMLIWHPQLRKIKVKRSGNVTHVEYLITYNYIIKFNNISIFSENYHMLKISKI
jgi:hypothetical protein